MEHQETSVEIFENFTWKIANFSKYKNVESIYSEPFVLGGYPWSIHLYQKGNKKDGNLSIFLESVHIKTANASKQWSRDVKFRLVVYNHIDTNRTITRGEPKNEFNESNKGWGYPDFMPLVDLHDPQKGFIVKDVLIVGVEVSFGKKTNENRVSQAASLTGHTNVEVPRPKPEVKDINDKACEDLQVLWEELEKYRSDLTWLEPHVQSALKIKNYVEKALHVEKLKAKLVAAEENLNTERDLLKAKGT
ncbi:hypothetical protein TSUD_341200 [Trifolium subterraneum]|uniref:MATH domain-containing protein n=1 Tax=Trifolium subterraneum TaxID=3900 RepID=A0A2Z6MN98_TRISU|nr:hypothetical protein TSUD_341200 [Trifolium subterraneum]